MKKFNFGLRHQLMASTLLFGMATVASPAMAQNNAADSQPPEQVGDNATDICASNPNAAECLQQGTAIVVTGSRIASPTLTSPSPLQVLDSRDIQDSGQLNVQSVLQENPAVSAAPTYSRTNSNFITSGAGVASIDLRNLGTQRTLVLINGHRTVAGVPGTNIVDLNTIPTQFIERIEVLTGGASSVYGSDAIAGVVNFIYKKNFSGIELSAQNGISDRGDDFSTQLGAMIGANFDDGRGNVMVYAGYTKEDGVGSKDRIRSNIDQSACYVAGLTENNGGCRGAIFAGDNTDLFTAYRPFFSGFAPDTTVTYGASGTVRIVGPGGVLTRVNTNGLVHNSDGVSATVRACTTADPCHPTIENATGFNRSQYRLIAVPVERYLLAFRGNYAISDHVNATLEGNFMRSSTSTLSEPFAFSTAGPNGIAPAACQSGVALVACNGFVPIESYVAGVKVRNPYVPDAIYNAANDQTGDGLKDVSFTRRLTDFGPRTYTARRQNFRVLAGLDGDFGNDNWHWDTYFTYGQTTESQVGSGQVNLNSFLQAVQVIPSANGPICADATARAQGCAPANIFNGAGAFSAAAVNYIQAGQSRNTSVEQIDTGGNITGTLIELPAGPLGVAVGVEYRKETSAAVNDPLTVAGLNGGNAQGNTFGSFDVKEAYAEVAIPILSHRPFFETLSVRGAGRVSKYSTVGTVYSYNAGLEWAPVRDIRFRAVYATATRAPNIGELYAGPGQTFPTNLVDRCIDVTATSTSDVSARCRQEPGVLANIAGGAVGAAVTGAFAYNQADNQGISGFNTGNPNVQEEQGKTFTLGAVINPVSINALRNLVVTVDYFDIKIKDLIGLQSRQALINACYGYQQAQDESACAFITRRLVNEGPNSAGSLKFVNVNTLNQGDYETTGIDATLSYRTPFLGGTLLGKLAYTHIFTLRDPSAGAVDNAGEEGAPWDRASGSISYTQADWTLTARGNWLGHSYLPYPFSGVEAGKAGSGDYRIASYFTADMQARWRAGDHFEFYAGVTNLFDKEPPPLITGLPGNDTGVETDGGTYDPIGRRYYAGAKIKF